MITKLAGLFENVKSLVNYRTISSEHYEELSKTNRVRGTGETTTSPTLEFSEKYEGYLVQFKVKRGTIKQLEKIGVAVRNHREILRLYPSLDKDIAPWSEEFARFKLERNQINIALGKGRALDLFNDNIIEFKLVRKGNK